LSIVVYGPTLSLYARGMLEIWCIRIVSHCIVDNRFGKYW